MAASFGTPARAAVSRRTIHAERVTEGGRTSRSAPQPFCYLVPPSWCELLRVASYVVLPPFFFLLFFAPPPDEDFRASVEDDLELRVKAFFQLLELMGQVGVGGEEAVQADEGAHDLDVDLHGPVAVQDAGKHGDALFGEGVG